MTYFFVKLSHRWGGCSLWEVSTGEAMLLEKYKSRLGMDLRLFSSLSLSHLSTHLFVYLYIYNVNSEENIALDSAQYDNLGVLVLMVEFSYATRNPINNWEFLSINMLCE